MESLYLSCLSESNETHKSSSKELFWNPLLEVAGGRRWVMKKPKARNAREQRTAESLKDRRLQTLCLQTPYLLNRRLSVLYTFMCLWSVAGVFEVGLFSVLFSQYWVGYGHDLSQAREQVLQINAPCVRDKWTEEEGEVWNAAQLLVGSTPAVGWAAAQVVEQPLGWLSGVTLWKRGVTISLWVVSEHDLQFI